MQPSLAAVEQDRKILGGKAEARAKIPVAG